MMEQQHILEFSPDGKLLALINESGILRIWDTETNQLQQEYTPNLHLSGPCTCITWLSVSFKSKSKKERKSIHSEQSPSLYIAMGTSKGGVSLYSYAAAKIERTFQGDGHTGSVTGITFDSDSNILYTIGEDCHIVVWNIYEQRKITSWSILSSGGNTGQEKPTSITYLMESKNLLIGCRQILLYSTIQQEIIQKFTGHTSDVILLKTFIYNDIEYAITASKMERILCVWRLQKKSKHKNAICTLLMEDIAYCLSCKIDICEDNILKIVAVTRSGRIHAYFVSMDNIKVEKPLKPTVTVEVTSDNAGIVEPLPAIAASLNFNCKGQEILFAYGDKNFLVFEKIVLNFTEKLQILTRTNPKYLRNKTQQQEQENVLKIITPYINENDVSYKSSILVSTKKQKSIQIPMETRLQNLHLTNGEIPQAQSKVQLLIQALHSKDSELLNTVLSTKDAKVIQLTLQKLPIQYVESLVNELTSQMQKKRTSVQIASAWLKVLVRTHTSQLMAFGSNDLLTKFGPCLGIIEHRANCLKELSKLNGRLNLLVDQIKRNTEEEENHYNENVLIYEDKDSSNSDLEDDAEEKSLSNDEWYENDNDDDEEDEENEDHEKNNMEIDE